MNTFLKTSLKPTGFQTKKDNQIFFQTLKRVLQNLRKNHLFESKWLEGQGKFYRRKFYFKVPKVLGRRTKNEWEKRNSPVSPILIGNRKLNHPKNVYLYFYWMVRTSYPDSWTLPKDTCFADVFFFAMLVVWEKRAFLAGEGLLQPGNQTFRCLMFMPLAVNLDVASSNRFSLAQKISPARFPPRPRTVPCHGPRSSAKFRDPFVVVIIFAAMASGGADHQPRQKEEQMANLIGLTTVDNPTSRST